MYDPLHVPLVLYHTYWQYVMQDEWDKQWIIVPLLNVL